MAEKELLLEYGLNRKFEIWKMSTILKNFTRQAKNLTTAKTPQVEKEKNQLLTKLFSLGLLGKDGNIEDILSLTLKDILERRLQTLVFRKDLSSSIRQARQFIVHEHISLGDKTITAPSYLVPLEEENTIRFTQSSVLSSPSHPGRIVVKELKEKTKAVEKETKVEEKVEKMVEKTKKFVEGKEKTAADIIEEVQKGKEIPSAIDLKKQKEEKISDKKNG